MRNRRVALVVAGLVSLSLGSKAAHAEPVEASGEGGASIGAAPKKDVPATSSAEREAHDGFQLGALAGVGFPHPLAIEAVARFDDLVMVGAEYGFFPKTTIQSVDAQLWSVAADLRVFPFRGAFFVGLRGGYQSVSASAKLTASGIGSYTEALDLGTWFLNPRIGFLWTPKPFAIGIDAGLQIPLSTTITRSSLLALADSSLDSQVRDAAYTLGKTPLPTIDLLRIGFLF